MQIDVFQLPAEARLHTIPVDKSIKAGETSPYGDSIATVRRLVVTHGR
jgi:hypothetical protein